MLLVLTTAHAAPGLQPGYASARQGKQNGLLHGRCSGQPGKTEHAIIPVRCNMRKKAGLVYHRKAIHKPAQAAHLLHKATTLHAFRPGCRYVQS